MASTSREPSPLPRGAAPSVRPTPSSSTTRWKCRRQLAEAYPHFARGVVAIGVFAGVADQFVDDHAQRHGLVGVEPDRLGLEPDRARRARAPTRFPPAPRPAREIFVHRDALDIVGGVEPAVDLGDRLDAALGVLERGARLASDSALACR